MSFLLKDEAYDRLVEIINGGRIEYGKVYSLNAIAEELNMSKTPVRDAIQKLCDENRIDVLPSRGFRIHVMTDGEIMQHYNFSNAIEGYCVYRMALECKAGRLPKSVENMRELTEKMSRCLSDDVPFAEYFNYDKSFHLEILKSLDDPYFTGLQYSMMGFYDHPELQLSEKSVARNRVYNCHMSILEHIISGDQYGAYDAMIGHAELMLEVNK